jgi:hypothetical protein
MSFTRIFGGKFWLCFHRLPAPKAYYFPRLYSSMGTSMGENSSIYHISIQRIQIVHKVHLHFKTIILNYLAISCCPAWGVPYLGTLPY